MYSIYRFGRMMGDDIRMDRYIRALKGAIHPGCTVVDLGTGTGIFAMLACRFGAERVYAIEIDDSINVAEQSARANGYANRIEFIQADSREVTLPTPADVLISDLRGVLPFLRDHIPTIVDARHRLLADSGTLIPARDQIWAAIAEAPDLYQRYTIPWGKNDFDLDLSAVNKLLVNSWIKGRVNKEQLLSNPECCFDLDYNLIENPNAKCSKRFTINTPGIGHGISAWFDATLADGLSFSNAPDAPALGYSMAFFPWMEPVMLEAGDQVELTLDARLVGDDYVWSWKSHILSGEYEKAHFKQSTFFANPISFK